MQIAMLIAQVLTAGGTGGILYTLGRLVSTVSAHGERIERLEQGAQRARTRGQHELAFEQA